MGAKLLFGDWRSIHWSVWMLIGVTAYGTVFQTFRILVSRNAAIMFNDFEIAGTVTYVLIISLSTIMLFILYPVVALIFFGFGLISLSVFDGLKFITFDFHNNKLHGLFVDRNIKLSNIRVDIRPGNDEIEIRTNDKADILLLNRTKYSDKVWSHLIENFAKLAK